MTAGVRNPLRVCESIVVLYWVIVVMHSYTHALMHLYTDTLIRSYIHIHKHMFNYSSRRFPNHTEVLTEHLSISLLIQ
jgi:hypothetical protein